MSKLCYALAGVIFVVVPCSVWAMTDDNGSPEMFATAFPGIVGHIEALAEVCSIKKSIYQNTISDAEAEVAIIWRNYGWNNANGAIASERQKSLEHYRDSPEQRNCPSFDRQLDNVRGWVFDFKKYGSKQ